MSNSSAKQHPSNTFVTLLDVVAILVVVGEPCACSLFRPCSRVLKIYVLDKIALVGVCRGSLLLSPGYRTELCTLPECGDSNENQAYPIDAGSCGVCRGEICIHISVGEERGTKTFIAASHEVECAVGYGGMNPSAMCDTAGGTFSLSGCEPLCVLPATYTGMSYALDQ
eukprot:5131657-Amphidinium_carterae.1